MPETKCNLPVIKGVIFDMDGTILDTESLSLGFWIETLKKYGIELDKNIVISLMGTSKKAIIDGMNQRYGDRVDIEKVYEEKNEAMLEYMEKQAPDVKKGYYELKKYLDDNGYKTAIATATVKDKVALRMKFLKLDEDFDFVVCGSDIKNSKPDPEIFLKAAEGIGLKPEECVVLEDSKAGVTAAYRGGFKCINIPDLKIPDDDMKRMADAELESLDKVVEYLEKINRR